LNYDIAKAHSGELKVETSVAKAAALAGEEIDEQPEGKSGTTFTICLPV
jgi:signal transduction histidine kinase